MNNAPTRERILWTTEEAQQIVDRFAELRTEDLLAPYTLLLARAQEILPEDRRRNCPGLSIYGSEVNRLLRLKLAEMKAKLCQSLREISSEPQIVTIEVPKIVERDRPIDPQAVLNSLSIGTVLGSGIDRLLAGLQHATPDKQDQTPTPRECLSKATAIESTTKPIRILIIGLFPESRRFVEEKVKTLTQVQISVCDSSQNKIPNGRFDYVIMMRRIVSHRQAEMVRDTHGRDRIIYVEGGQHELMQKIANLNSLRE